MGIGEAIFDTAMIKVWRKSWEPFRIYQLASTANPAHFTQLWLDWLILIVDPKELPGFAL